MFWRLIDLLFRILLSHSLFLWGELGIEYLRESVVVVASMMMLGFPLVSLDLR